MNESWKNFEERDRLLTEIWMLMILLVKTQKKVGSMVEKTYSLREYLNFHKETVSRNMDIKGTTGGGSDGN